MKYHVSFDIGFRTNPYKGKYIAFEGIDGSGKTTQTALLKKYFIKKGRSVVLTKEPTQKLPIGSLIHDFIKGRVKFPPVSLQYLFAADREIQLKEFVEPNLKKGNIVISDRCFWSSVAYGILDKIENSHKLNNKETLLVSESILSMYHQFIVPDITFYIDISADAAISRISKTGKKYMEYYETAEKLKQVKKGYDWMIKKFSKEFVVVNGERNPEEITKEIIKFLKLPK